MAPFSVSQLKDTASNVRSSGAEKFQNVRAKYTSRSSAESRYDPRDLNTKAPPPPPPRRTPDHQEQNETAPPPPVRRSTRPANDLQQPPRLPEHDRASQGIQWSALSADDKNVFFGWLDEFFGAKGSPGSLEQGPRVASSKTTNGQGSANSLHMSHPPPSEHGSAAQDLCIFFSSVTRWDTPWFSSQNPMPPPLEKATDCMRTHSIQWRGDTRTLSGGVLFSDLSACWYTVEWTQRNAHDSDGARRSAAFIPKPNALSQNTLVAAHETYGETVAAYAEGYEGTGQWCARGECWDLASEALRSFEQWAYVPKPIPSIGKTHGHLIYEGKAWGKKTDTEQAGLWRGGDDRIRRGDIVQWKSATITEGYARFTLGEPDHTAIIVTDQQPLRTPANNEAMRPADLGCLEVVEQSVHSAPSRKVYPLKGMEAGELWIYRPIGMEVYLNVLFSAKWPEGLQAASTST